MPIRPLTLPEDLPPMAEAAIEAFQYPEHPEWGLPPDEQEARLQFLRRLRKTWPIVRFLQALSPALRDLVRGLVWEEEGAICAMTLAQREGTSGVWSINTVGVVPSHRRRGIARELMLSALELVRQRGGTCATLAVIEQNEPARTLYRSLGFAGFSAYVTYSLAPRGLVNVAQPPLLPSVYRERPLKESDWQTRYELDRRIVPEATQRFAPVLRERYRPPPLLRLVAPLLKLAQGTRTRDLVIQRTKDGRVVACAGWSLQTRGKGLNRIRIRLDPDCPGLARILLQRSLHDLRTRSPALRVEVTVPSWIPALAEAAEEAGFVKRTTHLEMGIRVSAGAAGCAARGEVDAQR